LNEDKLFCVYKHTFPNGKVYIGITCRKPEHRWDHGKGYIPCPKMWNAIQKYGWDNVLHEILFDSLTAEEAQNKEIELIAHYNSTDNNCGYNICIGGSLGMFGVSLSDDVREKMSLAHIGMWASDEAKANMSKAQMGNKNNLGKPHSQETREKISAANKGNQNWLGKKHSKETLEKMSQAQKGRVLSQEGKDRIGAANKGNQTWLGRHHSEETKKKLSECRLGKKWSVDAKEKFSISRSKPIRQLTIDGEFVRTWGGAYLVFKELGIDASGISKCCRGINKSIGGYCWEFINKESGDEEN